MTAQIHDPISVLLIEDNAADAGLVRAFLADRTEPHFELHHATTLAAGLRIASGITVDIIVVDLSLPDSRGLASFLEVSESAPGVPIVVLSGSKDNRLALDAVRHGAQDFFSKDVAISESLGRSLQYTIERFHRQNAEREIDAAAFIQRRLYPHPLPPLTGLDVAGRCDPANQVGGDYFDYFLADDNRLMLVIGDVSGHGFGPSLVMAETRAAVRTMATMTDDIGMIIRRVNELLVRDDLATFVSLFLAQIDIATGVCKFASAGQPAQLIRVDGSTETLEGCDPPLGVKLGSQLDVRETQLNPNDTLLLFTDGITERCASTSNLFGVARMLHVMIDSVGLNAAETLERLFESANAFGYCRPAADDMTAIVLKVTRIAAAV